MSARRLAAGAILAAAALTLSACGSEETTASGHASVTPSTDTSAAATAPTPSSTTAEGGQPGAPGAKPTATAGGGNMSGNSKPAADCTAKAKHPGHKVINAVSAWGSPNRIGANETKFVCGPDVPNDGYYKATVSSADAYEFAAGAAAQLLIGVQAKDVTIDVLLQHVNTCTQNPQSTSPYSCYGNMYDVTLDASGKITQIHELYHP